MIEENVHLLDIVNRDFKAIIDLDDVEKCSKYNWYETGGHIYGYFGYNKKIQLSRYIMNVVEDSEAYIDHKNHNLLDNRKENLRKCTNQQNSFNTRKKRGTHTSKYKGVSWGTREQKWRANIMYNYKQIYLGTFHSEREAALAYNRKATELFEEYAFLNQIEEKSNA